MPTARRNGSKTSSTRKKTTSKGASSSRGSGKTCAQVMTKDPVTLLESETIDKAAKVMRENDIGDVMVLDDTNARLKGIVTDRDVVVRAVAEEMDPTRTTLASILTERLVCVGPGDSLDKAARIMRDKAIRRLPVVEDEQPVGFISIGDLAKELDGRSALAEISAAPPSG